MKYPKNTNSVIKAVQYVTQYLTNIIKGLEWCEHEPEHWESPERYPSSKDVITSTRKGLAENHSEEK